MKKPLSRIKLFWLRFARVTRIVIICIVLLFIGIRLALPHIIKTYVNKKLDQLPQYDGRIGDIDLSILRGAYTINHLDIVKTKGSISVPFFSAERVDFSVEWKELLHGSIVSEIFIDQAKLNFVKGETKKKSQLDIDQSWIDIVEELFPFKINRFEIRRGEIWYRDFSTDPKIDLYINHLFLVATNLTNSQDSKTKLPAELRAQAHTLGHGTMGLHIRLNPFARVPTFDVDAKLEKIDLVAFNDFLRAYANVDAKKGTLDIYIEMAASNGKMEGYIKPLIEDLDMVDLKQDNYPLEIFWEGFVSVLIRIFTNQPKDRFGTKIPISGSFDNQDMDILASIGNIIKNAFFKVLQPTIEKKINLEDVEKRE